MKRCKLNWYKRRIGIYLEIKRTFSNDGPSDHTWIIIGRHPLDSITWIWAVYWTKPSKWYRFFKCFHMARQDPMWRERIEVEG